MVPYTRIIVSDLIWTLHQRIITIQWAIDEDLSWEDRNEIHFHSRSSFLFCASLQDRGGGERNEIRGDHTSVRRSMEGDRRKIDRKREDSSRDKLKSRRGEGREKGIREGGWEKCRISCVTVSLLNPSEARERENAPPNPDDEGWRLRSAASTRSRCSYEGYRYRDVTTVTSSTPDHHRLRRREQDLVEQQDLSAQVVGSSDLSDP